MNASDSSEFEYQEELDVPLSVSNLEFSDLEVVVDNEESYRPAAGGASW